MNSKSGDLQSTKLSVGPPQQSTSTTNISEQLIESSRTSLDTNTEFPRLCHKPKQKPWPRK